MKEKYSDLISVIVPCYNVEKYVKKGIISIKNQIYSNIEIIAVDDCSTDNTYAILKELENEYDNLKVYKNAKNVGLASTRNFGVSKSKGKYIGFIDPDDYIEKDFYVELYNTLIQNDADLSICNMILTDEEGEPLGEELQCCIGGVNKLNAINNGLAASACNKLFKKEEILKFPFLDGKVNEDVASIVPIMANCNKISYTNKVRYYYLQRSTSIQNSKFSDKRFDMFDAVETCLEKMKDCKNYEQYKDAVLFQQVLMLYIYIILEQKPFTFRYKIIKKFEKLQRKYKVYNNSLFYKFYMEQRKRLKIYYIIVVKLLKIRAVMLINIIVTLKFLFGKLGRFMKKFKTGIKNFTKRLIKKIVIPRNLNMNDLINACKKQAKLNENDIKISVVIPNYNYERFMFERFYSILNQTVKLHEIIILDDCSKDNSRKLIDGIVDNISKYVKITKIYNEENSGSAFKQWAKGFKIATGDYVWIAEADDYCNKKMLENLLIPIKNNSDIYISYVDTAFVDKIGNVFLKTIKPEIDIMKTGHWNSDFVNSGIDEIKNYTFLNCTIANVSSCIIKNEEYDDIFKNAGQYRQAGDWVFYSYVMSKGKIAYINKTMNYYRVHGDNITSQMKKQKHLEEIKSIHEDLSKNFGTNDFQSKKREERYEFLKEVWNLNDNTDGKK